MAVGNVKEHMNSGILQSKIGNINFGVLGGRSLVPPFFLRRGCSALTSDSKLTAPTRSTAEAAGAAWRSCELGQEVKEGLARSAGPTKPPRS